MNGKVGLLFGFCCGLPLLVCWYVGSALVRRHRRLPLKTCWLLGFLPWPFVALAAYGEGRYILLEEGVVIDACVGDANGVAWRLKVGGDVNAKTEDDLGALGCAVTNSHVEAARVLLEHGADPDELPAENGDPFWSKTPRQWAIASNDPTMIRLFRRFPKRVKP